MDATKKKNLILIFLFAFVQGLMLVREFSWFGLIVSAIPVICTTFKVFVLNSDHSFEVKFCNLVSLSLLCVWIDQIRKIYIPGESFSIDDLTNLLSKILGADLWMGIFLVAVFVVSLFLGLNVGVISISLKYIAGFGVCQIFKWVKSSNGSIDLFLLVFMVIGLLLDLKVNNERKRGSKVIFISTLLTALFINAVEKAVPDKDNTVLFEKFAYETFEWNPIYFVLILVFFVAGAYLVYSFEKDDENSPIDAPSDIVLAGIDVMFMMLFTKNESEYSWLFLVVLAVVNIIIMFSRKTSTTPYKDFIHFFKSKIGLEMLCFALLVMLLYSVKTKFWGSALILAVFILFSIFAKEFGWKCIIQNTLILAFSIVSVLSTGREYMLPIYFMLFIISSATMLILNSDIEKRSYIILNRGFRNKMIVFVNLCISVIPLFKFLK